MWPSANCASFLIHNTSHIGDRNKTLPTELLQRWQELVFIKHLHSACVRHMSASHTSHLTDIWIKSTLLVSVPSYSAAAFPSQFSLQSFVFTETHLRRFPFPTAPNSHPHSWQVILCADGSWFVLLHLCLLFTAFFWVISAATWTVTPEYPVMSHN